MARVEAGDATRLDPERAFRLWTDTGRWPTFVEGFAAVVERDELWPGSGGRLVWQSGAGGRGRVTERVLESEPGRRIVSRVYEPALQGVVSVTFEPVRSGEAGEEVEGTGVELALEYELAESSPLRRLTDVLFIRRALRDAQRRTLRRFAVEADEEASL